jgi:hypothetical protein
MLRLHLNVATVGDNRVHGWEASWTGVPLGVLGENVVLLLHYRVAREPALGVGYSPFLRRRGRACRYRELPGGAVSILNCAIEVQSSGWSLRDYLLSK